MSRARRDLLARLRAMDEPASVDALSRECGQHPNTVREHLEALVVSGQAQRVSAAAPAGRGRPARLYRAVERPVVPAAAATLASVLAAQLAGRPEARAEGVAAGRVWAQGLRDTEQAAGGGPQHHTPTAVRGRIATTLTETGFVVEQDDEDSTVLRLTGCPLLEAAREHPDVVCSVHLGLVQGLLDDAGDTETGARLLPFATSDACLLHLGAGAGS
ncbi:hypothetical protein JTF08_01770 [Micrococcaceae bacterium RIT802]|jgi:predicted ArsR family transcriptional regulator|nr:hypothetical protein [Micrococcaceae bacterium RIT 802]